MLWTRYQQKRLLNFPGGDNCCSLDLQPQKQSEKNLKCGTIYLRMMTMKDNLKLMKKIRRYEVLVLFDP